MVLAILGIAGVLATFIAINAFEDDQSRQQQDARETGSTLIGTQAVTQIQESITAAQRLALTTVADWPSTAEYDEVWDSFAPSLPGDSTAVVVLLIEPEEVAAFEEAERAITPGFMVQPGGASGDGRFLVARSASPDIPLGLDLNGQPEIAEQLLMIPESAVRVFQSDIRDPATPGNQLQLVRRLRSEGPDGVRRQGWSIVQLDLTPALTAAVESAGPGFGAQFDVDGFDTDLTFGIDRPVDATIVTRTELVGPVEITIDAWSAIDTEMTVSRVGIAAAGLAITLTAMLLARAATSMIATRRRARADARDARHDHLTGIPNRRWVNERLRDLHGQPVAVLFCDLDRFKVVNDSAGHAAGDEILIEVSRRIQATLDEHTNVARFGGDEFLLVCSGNTANVEAHAQRVAEEIREAVAAPFDIGNSEFRTTLSVGIASTEKMVASDVEELLRAADVALGLCKQRGRNNVVTYDDRLRAAELDRLVLERDLQQALDNGDLLVYYQPLVDGSRRIVSYEALVRWKRNGELVMPSEFIPVVEEIGRMRDLGETVLRQAISEFTAGVEADSSITLHINVDATQLSGTAFPALVESVLQSEGLAPERLILELTEGEWGESIEEIVPVIEALATVGVRLAIDDFGTGHSGLGRTLNVPGLAEVKLDRSMVKQLFDERNRTFFTGFTSTLADLGISTVAEGIETEEDLRSAASTGIDCFQGFLFAQPAPAADIDFAATSTCAPFIPESIQRAA